jgi:hypothetical protein
MDISARNHKGSVNNEFDEEDVISSNYLTNYGYFHANET